jgi:hypothetical protein
MAILQVKPGVTVDRLAIAGARILQVVTQLAALTNFDWILSCATGGHLPTDPHTRGEAMDFGLTLFPNSSAVKAAKLALDAALGPAYTVLLEFPHPTEDPILGPLVTVNPKATGPHLHCQIKLGTTTIPEVKA